MPKLNQIIAIEKGVKSRVYGEITTLHKESQKTEVFSGFIKNYRKKSDDGEDFPPERKRVQVIAGELLKQVAKLQTELFDVEATKDWGNCHARADVVVEGQVLLKDVPATYLLFLEKQLSDMRTFLEKLPTLDEAEEWALDPNSNIYRSERTSTHRTRKVQRPIVLYEATKEHPAQTQLITEDVIVGWWDSTKHSGALPVPRKVVLLERVDRLMKAVKVAREKANDAEVEQKEAGEAIFGYLFDAGR
jgi:hypothetical protein